MSSSIFRNITHFSNLSKHFVTIDLQIVERNLCTICPVKSETFHLTDTDTCFLELRVNHNTFIPLLILIDVNNSGRIIESFTASVFDGVGSLVHSHAVHKNNVNGELNLLQNFKTCYHDIKRPIKLIFFLEIQNAAVKETTLASNSYENVQADCFRVLSSDFMKLHTQETDTDITVHVDGVSIEAHKMILRTRSPVFNKMFEHDTNESSDKVIDIKEISAPIFKEFLAFLYTAVTKNHDFDSARQLYYVADKYEVLSLRDDCKKDMLTHHLQEDNACQMLLLADQHQDEAFKEEVVKFMNANLISVIKTKEFEDLNKNYPELALTLVRNYFAKNFG